ncbi:MAG: hypothetical protein LC126_17390 [Bryobacterales bacterium]|nr:hypothetical protein [Bryobacterales bacterium]
MDVTSEIPALAREEWDLVLELLEREQRELLRETRHTRTSVYRRHLHQREQIVSRLLENLRVHLANTDSL